jgi:hypothetical protein
VAELERVSPRWGKSDEEPLEGTVISLTVWWELEQQDA